MFGPLYIYGSMRFEFSDSDADVGQHEEFQGHSGDTMNSGGWFGALGFGVSGFASGPFDDAQDRFYAWCFWFSGQSPWVSFLLPCT